MFSTTGTANAGHEAATSRPFQLSSRASFIAASVAFASLYLAAGAPTPLLVLFEREWAFPAWVLTVAFAAYALVVCL